MKALLCPLSDAGYLYPALAVGIELQARGHDVAVLARPEAEAAVAAAALPFRSAADVGDARAFSASRWSLQAADQYRAVLRAGRAHRPDVLVTTVLCLGALLAADVLDVPVVVLGFAVHLWDYHGGGGSEPQPASTRAWRTQEMARLYHAVREECGVPARAAWDDAAPLRGTALLLRGDPALEFPGAVLPPNVHHVGPCSWEPAAPEAEVGAVMGRLDQVGKPVVYVHVGRSFGGAGLWPMLNAVFTGGRYQAVVEQGRSADPQPSPDADIVVVRKPWLGPLVDRAGLVLCRGTSAPVLGALLAGRPLGVCPAGSEQPVLSRACVRAGVAVDVPPGVSGGPADVIDAAWQDIRLRNQAGVLGQRLAAADSRRRAAVYVEQAVTAGCAGLGDRAREPVAQVAVTA